MKSIAVASALALLVFASSTASASDWTRFRGPNGSGISEDANTLPAHWTESANVTWKVALPGPGSSSPIVVGDRVFVTCWSGYGLDPQNPGEQKELRRHLICIDRKTGKTIWSKAVEPVLPEDKYGGMFAQHGYASHTPVSDGERVFVYFGKTGALAFDMDGKQLWQQGVGTESDPHGWGSASSPILHKNLLIVTATAESEALVALDTTTGKEVWRQEAAGFNGTWGTPALVPINDKRTDLVLAVPSEVWGFDPDTGKFRWFAKTTQNSSFCSSVVAHDGIVYAMESGPGGGGGAAVRAGGNGDVTDTHVVWSGRQANRIGTPILHEGRLYSFSGGIARCFDLADGKETFRGRLESTGGGSSSAGGRRGGRGGAGGHGGFGGGGMGGQDYSSPVIADGKIYYTSRSGSVHVLEAGDEFKPIAVNIVTTEREDFSATPAISDGQLFLRSSKHLYCIASLQADDAVAELKAKAKPAKSEESDPPAVAGGDPPGGRHPGGEARGGRGGFTPAAMFDRIDADGDKKLTGDEITGMVKDNLDQIDKDKDGVVTLEEFESGISQVFSRMSGRRGQGGGRGGSGERGNPRRGRPERPQRPKME